MVTKCLSPVAGYGTRFLPATKAMPKEMLPILNTPLIQYGVEEAYEVGMWVIAFVTGRGKRAIEDHFYKTYELEDKISGTKKEKHLDDIRTLIDECTFSYSRQIEMKGPGDTSAQVTGCAGILQTTLGRLRWQTTAEDLPTSRSSLTINSPCTDRSSAQKTKVSKMN